MSSSNLGVPPRNDSQSDDYPVLYNEGQSQLSYVKTGVKNSISTGGSSYLVYTAMIAQAAAETPTLFALDNTLTGNTTSFRVSAGVYEIRSSTNAFTYQKTYIPGFCTYEGSGNVFIPIANYEPIKGYYTMYPLSTSAIRVEFMDEAFTNVDLSDLIGNGGDNQSRLFLPEIRVYP